MSWKMIVGICAWLISNVSAHTFFEAIHEVPTEWTLVSRASSDSRIRLRVSLKQPLYPIFEEKLLAVSTPGHPHYGLHLTSTEVKALLKPDDQSTSEVLNWLSEHGISGEDVKEDGHWITFNTHVGNAEALLNNTFHIYRNELNNDEVIRTLGYHVPSDVAGHINMVQPTTRFGRITPRKLQIHATKALGSAEAVSVSDSFSSDLNVTACNQTITPSCLRALYKINNYISMPSSKALLGVAGFLKEYAKYDALATFLDKYAPYAAGTSFNYTLINGGLDLQNDTQDDDLEGNVDMQYALSIGYETPVIFYSTGGLAPLVPDLDAPVAPGSNEPYLDFLDYMLKLDDRDLPQTITLSYGETEESVPEAYSYQVCSMFGQLGARGVSVIFSSGDTGPGSACQTNDGKNTTRFLPNFPAACPWVTSVGATTGVEPESAACFSSGGFSDRFQRPAYQNTVVHKYLEVLGDRWKGLYNPSGRAFPDVSAQGVNFHIIDRNASTGVLMDVLDSGTSCAAPTFAGMIALLNNARLSSNRPPLGFLNPWIYSMADSGFTDIVNGGSQGCTGVDIYSGLPTPYIPYAGWNATIGWDPVTGVGTPNFEALMTSII